MLRRALFLIFAVGPAALPAVSQAYDIKPKTPLTGFSGKLHPDILGLSPESTADAARAIFDARFKGHTDTQTDIQQQKLGDTGIGYVAALNFTLPTAPKQTGELLSGSFTSPASANRAYFIARNLTFAADQQPSKADMIKEVMDKYGVPTIVGDQHLYYIYRSGSIVSSGTKYKEATALDAIDKPLDPRAAVKLNGETVRGSCVAVIKRAQTKTKTLERDAGRGQGRQLRRRLERAACSGHAIGPGRDRAIHAAGRQARHQRVRDRQRGHRGGPERAQGDAEGQRAEALAFPQRSHRRPDAGSTTKVDKKSPRACGTFVSTRA